MSDGANVWVCRFCTSAKPRTEFRSRRQCLQCHYLTIAVWQQAHPEYLERKKAAAREKYRANKLQQSL